MPHNLYRMHMQVPVGCAQNYIIRWMYNPFITARRIQIFNVIVYYISETEVHFLYFDLEDRAFFCR